MRVLINSVNLKVGGGVTVAMNFFQNLIENTEFHDLECLVLAPSNVGYENYDKAPIKMEIIPKAMQSPLNRFFLDHTWLKKRIENFQPDVIFTMGNIAVPSKYKQAVLFMYPYAIYPDDKQVWKRLDFTSRFGARIRNLIFRSRLKHAEVIFPQTETSKTRLLRYYGNRINNIKVIPTAYSKIGEGILSESRLQRNPEFKYLLCLTKYYSHKNVEILIKLAQLIKTENLGFRILTTIDGDQGPGSQEFLNSIESTQLNDIVLNLGKVPMDQVPALYSQVDALLLPTLLESFSATYIDSMTLGVPIFTSDRDFARDVCGDAAWYFDPLNADNIFEVITSAFQSTKEVERRITIGKNRAASMPNWLDVTRMYVQALRELCPSLRICVLAFVLGCLFACKTTSKIAVQFENIVQKRDGNIYHLKKGTFLCKKTLHIPNGAKIIGHKTTLKVENKGVFPIFKTESVQNIWIDGISLHGSILSNNESDQFLMAQNYAYLIDANKVNGLEIVNCSFKGGYGSTLKMHDCNKVQIENCKFTDIGVASRKDVPYSYDAIFIGANQKSSQIAIENCTFNNIGKLYPDGNPPWPNDGDGIQIQGIGEIDGVTISNCSFTKCSSRGVKIQSGKNITISDCSFKNGRSAIIMALASSIENIDILNNQISNTLVTFGTDAFEGPKYVTNLRIENNQVDNCNHFFRTSGYSNVRNGLFKANSVKEVGTFFISGRFEDTKIIDNKVANYATYEDKDYQMCFLLSPESNNVLIEKNKIHGKSLQSHPLDNRSKNVITVKNNSFQK